MSLKWGLKDIETSKAWQLQQGSRRVVVAVIDTGIDPWHVDLRKNLWQNPGETGVDSKGRNKETNGVDDDKNGFVDDVHGWNFASNNSDITDHHGHGSHIAGIIGADGGNGVGVSGVSPNVSLMILKYYDPKAMGQQTLFNTVRAIEYAIKMGAHIINYSGGGLTSSVMEYQALKKAADQNVLVVAAAGNEASNSDHKPFYPADYDLPNILSVTAIDNQSKLLPTSNYGKHTVDIAAPGNEIYSTLHGGQYGYMTGTSQATAFVSGVAALLIAMHPHLNDPKILVPYLLATADKSTKKGLDYRYRTKLNSYRALIMKGDEFNAEGQVVKRVEGVSASEGHDRSVEVAKILRAYLNEKQAPRMPAKE